MGFYNEYRRILYFKGDITKNRRQYDALLLLIKGKRLFFFLSRLEANNFKIGCITGRKDIVEDYIPYIENQFSINIKKVIIITPYSMSKQIENLPVKIGKDDFSIFILLKDHITVELQATELKPYFFIKNLKHSFTHILYLKKFLNEEKVKKYIDFIQLFSGGMESFPRGSIIFKLTPSFNKAFKDLVYNSNFENIEVNTPRVVEMIQTLMNHFYKKYNLITDGEIDDYDEAWDEEEYIVSFENKFAKIILYRQKILLQIFNRFELVDFLKLSNNGINTRLNCLLFSNYKITIPYKFAMLLTYFDNAGIFDEAIIYFEKQIFLDRI